MANDGNGRLGFYSIINTYLILLVSLIALSSPRTAYEQGLPERLFGRAGRDTVPASQQAAYGISYPLLGSKKIVAAIPAALPPIFEEIARCESGGRQFDSKGKVIRGEVNSADMGKYQINLTIWKAEAQKLGYDLTTEEGNEQFALELYKRYGTLPWESSKPCWGKMAKTLAEK